MFNFIARWWKRITSPPEHQRPSLPVTDNFERQNIDLVICIAGHEENGGMTIYTGESENSNRRKLVKSIDESMEHDRDIYTVARKFKSYRKYLKNCKKEILRISKETGVALNRILVLEFHLNAAGRNARGIEYLTMTNAATAILRPIVESFSRRFNIVLRRDKGIYRIDSGNGAGFLRICKSLGCPGGIIEDCFAGFRTEESSQFFDNWQEASKKLTSFWVKQLRKVLDE